MGYGWGQRVGLCWASPLNTQKIHYYHQRQVILNSKQQTLAQIDQKYQIVSLKML